jgi:hypothetical protein
MPASIAHDAITQASGPIHMDNDGLDGIVIGKLLGLLHDRQGRENYAIQLPM